PSLNLSWTFLNGTRCLSVTSASQSGDDQPLASPFHIGEATRMAYRGLWKSVALVAIAALGIAGSPLRAEETEGSKKSVGGGEGVSFSSDSGDFPLQLGFWGQTRFQAYDRDQWRRTDRSDLTPPIPVENVGLTQYNFDLPLLRFYLRGSMFKPW